MRKTTAIILLTLLGSISSPVLAAEATGSAGSTTARAGATIVEGIGVRVPATSADQAVVTTSPSSGPLEVSIETRSESGLETRTSIASSAGLDIDAGTNKRAARISSVTIHSQ